MADPQDRPDEGAEAMPPVPPVPPVPSGPSSTPVAPSVTPARVFAVLVLCVLLAVACTGFALVLPIHSLEPFLLMLSSVFVPLYGVILARLGFGVNAAE